MIETVKVGTLRWSHIVLPTEEDFKILQERYHFHPLDIEDCRTLINLRPKIDIYDDYYFLILQFPSFDATRTFVEIKEIKVFWGKDFLITLGKSHWLVKEIFSQQTDKSGQGKTLEVGSSDELFYHILDYLIQNTQGVVEDVDKAVDACGKSLFNRDPEKTIEKISVTRKNVILLNTMFKPQLLLFNRMQSGNIEGFAGNMEDYWGNIVDYYQRVFDLVEDEAELIKGYSLAFDSLQVNKTNKVMRILTLISSLFLPLIFISSLLGMNIGLPFQNYPQSFLIVAGLMLAFTFSILIFFRIKRWM